MAKGKLDRAGRIVALLTAALFSSTTVWATIAGAETAGPAEAGDVGTDGGGHDGGRRGGPGGGHDDGGHDDGAHDDGGHDDGGHDDGGHDDGDHDDGGGRGGQGRGGEGRGGDGSRGGQGHGEGRGAGADARGGRPVWAGEGIPEVELGRLNVARAPGRVLDRAYAEALAVLASNPEMAAFYGMTPDEIEEALRSSFDDLAFIDSPLQNLALLRDALSEGRSVLATNGMTGMSDEELAAVFLGLASDKTVPVTADTVVAVTRILGLEVADAEALAAAAEEIRAAVAEGHG